MIWSYWTILTSARKYVDNYQHEYLARNQATVVSAGDSTSNPENSAC